MDALTHNAITMHAKANQSDPFAARKIATILHRGLDDPRRLIADAERQIATRLAATNAAHADWLASDARPQIMRRLFGDNWQSQLQPKRAKPRDKSKAKHYPAKRVKRQGNYEQRIQAVA